ncbi:MAG: AAA family ATPase [Candidatus Tectomicrobia bacterium]|nr:AAA family ATPase [Candidatus Tectomicrobia bacterium]
MIYTFVDCELDTQLYTLRRAGQPVRVRPKVFEVLRYLLEHRDRVSSKDELCEAVWPEQFISDATLVSTMRAVRRTIGDSGRGQQLIQTVFSYGYQFIAPVTEVDAASESEGVPREPEAESLSEPLAAELAEVTDTPPRSLEPSPPEASAMSDAGDTTAPLMESPLPSSISASTRRQLTVLFCHLRDITSLGAPLDPEDLPDVLHVLQETCEAVIQREGGYVAAVLGNGVWAYFGYPQAYDDTPHQAVRASLALLEALEALQPRLEQDWGVQVQARVGLHTGIVVVNPSEAAAGMVDVPVGETPTLAGKLAALAPPRAVVMSDTTARLVQGAFESEDLRSLPLTGGDPPVSAYRVHQASQSPDPLEIVASPSLTPFVGRDAELGLLLSRWSQAQSGWGQVVLLSGEPGIGKSRLIQELSQHVKQTQAARIVFRCSPQAAQTPFYPIITHLHRLLEEQSDASPEQALSTLEQTLESYAFPLEETVPLMAALLSLPVPPERYLPLRMSALRQRQRTQEVLIGWLMAVAERQPLLAVFENVHWADPSTVELIGMFLERVQTLPVLMMLAYRPEFEPPWPIRSPFMGLVLPRLDASAITTLIAGLAQGKVLPARVVQHVMDRTDGVPLFVEECAKMLLEGEWLEEQADHYALSRPLPEHEIPVTLQDTLLARLDRLSPGAEVARLGAVCGREFSRELLEALPFFDEATVEGGLSQLVEAELVYPVRFGSPVRYRFKHALIQEVAYQSLLRRQRRQVHEAIAKALETQFPETGQSHPELLAYHYTEAGQVEPAVVYWQRAGEAAIARSAHVEAIAHLTKGLEVAPGLSNELDRVQRELEFQIALGTPLAATQGYGAPEVEGVYTRARELCRQLGDTPQLFPVLSALTLFYVVRGTVQSARELGEQLVHLAEQSQEPTPLLEADYLFGIASFWGGEVGVARQHLEAMLARYDPAKHGDLVFCYGEDPRIQPVFYHANALWILGYPDQARIEHERALSQAQSGASPLNLAFALNSSARFHQFVREVSLVHTQSEAVIALAIEQGFPFWSTNAAIFQGWARAVQGQGEDGIAQICQALSSRQATGAVLGETWIRALLAEAYGHIGQPETGRQVLAEAQEDMEGRGERVYEAELYRLDGDLLIMQDDTRGQEAEAQFLHALEVARCQQAKAWELRAAMSLSRLWRRQGKLDEAQQLLDAVYDGFTEGFDTADLQEAKALLDDLRA